MRHGFKAMAVLVSAWTLGGAGCETANPTYRERKLAEARARVEARQAQLERVVALMCGSFSSEQQSAEDPDFFDIRLEMARIWPERQDGAWIYVEQAVASALANPYRQRIYRVTVQNDGSVRSDVYLMPGDPRRFAGAWKDTSRLDDMHPKDLLLRDGCSVVLKADGPDRWVGGTVGNGCPSDRSGAAYATSEVTLTPEGFVTLDRGYAPDGTQVWGSHKGGYIFRRVAR